MGITLEGTGPLRLPRKRSRTRSKLAKKFDPHAAFEALIKASRVGIDARFVFDIANGEGVVAELALLPHMHEMRRQLGNEITRAAKHVEAVIHLVETAPTKARRSRVLVAVLPPDTDLAGVNRPGISGGLLS